MTGPAIDHLHITMGDMMRAEGAAREYALAEYHHANFSFGFVCPRPALAGEKPNRRRPGAVRHTPPVAMETP